MWISIARVARPGQSFSCPPSGLGRRPSFYLICRHRWRSNQFQSILREKVSSRSPCGDLFADGGPRREDAYNGRTIINQLYRFQSAFSMGACRQAMHGWSIRGRLCDPLIAFSGPVRLRRRESNQPARGKRAKQGWGDDRASYWRLITREDKVPWTNPGTRQQLAAVVIR